MKVINLADFQGFSSEKMKKHNVFETPRFFCDVYCFEPDQVQKGHVHADEDKIYMVLEGHGTFRVGRILGPGASPGTRAGDVSPGR